MKIVYLKQKNVQAIKEVKKVNTIFELMKK